MQCGTPVHFVIVDSDWVVVCLCSSQQLKVEMYGSSVIARNHAAGNGGVFFSHSISIFMTDASKIRSNWVEPPQLNPNEYNGGGVIFTYFSYTNQSTFIDSVHLEMDGQSQIHNNSAPGELGGVIGSISGM